MKILQCIHLHLSIMSYMTYTDIFYFSYIHVVIDDIIKVELLKYLNPISTNDSFIELALKGNIDVCKIFYSRYKLSKRDIFPRMYTLHWIIATGNIEICNWIYSNLDLSECDMIACNNQGFRRAAERGHLEMCKWLHSTFDIDIDTKADRKSVV